MKYAYILTNIKKGHVGHFPTNLKKELVGHFPTLKSSANFQL